MERRWEGGKDGGRKEGRRKEGRKEGRKRKRRREKRKRRHKPLALEPAGFPELRRLAAQSPSSPTNTASIQEGFPSRDLLLSASLYVEASNLGAP